MRKTFALFVSLFCLGFVAFAQESYDTLDPKPADTSIEKIIPKNTHSDIRTASVVIEYIRMADEVRIYYSCLDVQFDRGDAMNAILGCLKDFQVENQYIRYNYLAKDRTRYYQDGRNKMAQYSSYVKFER